MQSASDNNPDIYYDKDGTRYSLTINGKRIPPLTASPNDVDATFITYNTSEGHCGLCGNLFCRGQCFK